MKHFLVAIVIAWTSSGCLLVAAGAIEANKKPSSPPPAETAPQPNGPTGPNGNDPNPAAPPGTLIQDAGSHGTTNI